MSDLFLPDGFAATGWRIGVKETNLSKEDFGVLFSERPATAHAIFTRNRFPGHPVTIGRRHIQSGRTRCIIVNSGNANVANGPDGLALAEASCRAVAQALHIAADEVLPSSTGVIGRPMPAEKVLAACAEIPERLRNPDVQLFVRAIMTTDRFAKNRALRSSRGFSVTGLAKGAGMIEPNMATMLSYMLTDARIGIADLRRWLPFLASRSFNRISVDSDTSTSDTFAFLANGASGVDVEIREQDIVALQRLTIEEGMELLDLLSVRDFPVSASHMLRQRLECDDVSGDFMAASMQIALFLAREIVRDGEGATRRFRVIIQGAATSDQAARIGRSILNSPLVKTAVTGADPNWGRLIMAVGKVFDESHPDPQIWVGPYRMYPPENSASLAELEAEMRKPDVDLRVDLRAGKAWEVFYGCDLTCDYVKLNSEYTT